MKTSLSVTPSWVRIIRWFLAVVYLVYGGIKLAGGQFYHGAFSLDSRTLDGPSFVWAFYGWSTPYSLFAGMGEFVPAVLLLFSRTATLGAAMLFPVALNITVMTFAFHFPPVKYASLFYTILLGALLAHDLPRLWPAFVPPVAPVNARLSRVARVVLAVVGIPVVVVAAAAIAESLSPTPELAVKELLVARGIAGDSVHLVRSRYTGQLFGREGFVEYRTRDSTRVFRAAVRKPIAFVAWRVDSVSEVAR